jgi:hypothetical protein
MDKKKRSKAAAELGRRGGLKGGAARARALTPEQRKEISQKANAVRWKSPKEQIITDDIGPSAVRAPAYSWRLDPALADRYTHIRVVGIGVGRPVLEGLTHDERWEPIPPDPAEWIRAHWKLGHVVVETADDPNGVWKLFTPSNLDEEREAEAMRALVNADERHVIRKRRTRGNE